MIIANTKHPIVAALPHPDHPTMLVTNAVAALANGWGGYAQSYSANRTSTVTA